MLSAGMTAAEVAAARGLSAETVFDHALRAAEEGQPVEAGWFLDEATQAIFRQVIGDRTPPRIRPLLANLPAGTRYEEVQYYLKCRKTA